MHIKPQDLNINGAASAIFDLIEDPKVLKARDTYVRLQEQHESLERTLALPSDTFIAGNRSLYNDIRVKKAASQTKIAMSAGAVCAIGSAAAILLAGLTPALSIGLGICSLPLCLSIVPQIYAKAVSKLIMPAMVEHAMRDEIKDKQHKLDVSLKQAEDELNRLMAPYMINVGDENSPGIIECGDENEFINIGGVKLKKKGAAVVENGGILTLITRH